MKIVDVSFIYDDRIETEEQQLKQHYTTVGWAEALQKRGVEVVVLKRFHRESSFRINDVRYHFVKDKFGANLRAWQIPWQFLKMISEQNADVIHLHNFSLSLQTLLLRFLLTKKTAIIIQHHGGPLPGGIKKQIHDRINSIADGFFFTTVEQGRQWFTSKNQQRKLMPVMEGSTFFNFETRDAGRNFEYKDRGEARKITGMTGQPVFLWVGRLDDNKDPLTVLSAFEVLFEKYSGASLYIIYGDEKIEMNVKHKINKSEILKERVRLLGEIEHEKIENYYQSADYFVLGSHYEGSGYALSEAMKCGCVPIVTDIPSFRMMTNNGQAGCLWKVGDKYSLIETVVNVMAKPSENQAKACIDAYKHTLSFDAIAETAIEHYHRVIQMRQGK